ncbi:hypothetical protein BLNAU_16756 [Blattamonas nauphoetae]|uniref:Uncharacterized protein n=1 Tax=Blattamonas nauphoetae TaxID=2049346 RepID=A0ABQ9X843_9EUKA|nr:hypothetical protein BLNAU_16756 [Blattamonas nauphoetae]
MDLVEFACSHIDFETLASIVSSDEDVITLFHSTGLSLAILSEIQPQNTTYDLLMQLAKLSELRPLPFEAILCNEYLACSIIGCGEEVYETIVSNFPSCLHTLPKTPRHQYERPFSFGTFREIMKISQKYTDPVQRILAFIECLSHEDHLLKLRNGSKFMNLSVQCLQYTATFLNAHPELIDSFLSSLALSSHPSDIHFRHDRHLNLISTLSHEPLLDPTLPLDSLLSPRSFTDPASSFLRLANTNPSLFHRLVETHARPILDIAVSTALHTVRVVSADPSEPHCLDFGRVTQNWIVLLNAMTKVTINLTQKRRHFITLPSSLVTFLVLSAASTNADMSTAAVSVFSKQFGLSTQHTETLLFATPTSFPLGDAFTLRHSQELEKVGHMRSPSQSICAEVGSCVVLLSRSEHLSADKNIALSLLGIHFAGSLVNTLHSTTTLPHSFPFFSPELRRLSQQPNVWNDTRQPSALSALTTLADITRNIAFPISRESNLPEADEESRHINFVHLFPFLGVESQTQLLSSFYRSVVFLVEMATVNSYNTPIALLTEMRKVAGFLSYINPTNPYIGSPTPAYVSPFEISIVEKLKVTEGEERWKLLTQLAVLSSVIPNFTNELIKAENDAQALLILSIHTIRSIPTLDFHLSSNPAVFDRLVELAGHINNLPLVSVAMEHICTSLETHFHPPHDPRMNPPRADLDRLLVSPSTNAWLSIGQRHALSELVLDALCEMSVLRRGGVEEGFVVGRDEMTSQIVTSCLKMLRVLMSAESFDPTPFVESLVSLVVTTDPSLLRSILLVLPQIEERTRNTTTPFSISTATAPFRGIHESSVNQQPLPSIVATILLFASIKGRI